MSDNVLTRKVNSYLSVLLITIIGAAASLTIIHVATQTSYPLMGIESIEYAEGLLPDAQNATAP
jgi:hypothetical protein